MTKKSKKGSLNIAQAMKKTPVVVKKTSKPVEPKKSQVIVVPKKAKVEVKDEAKPAKKIEEQETVTGNKKEAEYLLFIEWCGTPLFERTPKTQKELAIQLKTTEATLSDWKKRKGFWDKVASHTRKWGNFRTSDLIGALYTQIITSRKPTGRDLMVWLQYIEKFNPKLLLEDETPLERKYDPEQRKLMANALLNAGLANQAQVKAFATEEDNDEDNDN